MLPSKPISSFRYVCSSIDREVDPLVAVRTRLRSFPSHCCMARAHTQSALAEIRQLFKESKSGPKAYRDEFKKAALDILDPEIACTNNKYIKVSVGRTMVRSVGLPFMILIKSCGALGPYMQIFPACSRGLRGNAVKCWRLLVCSSKKSVRYVSKLDDHHHDLMSHLSSLLSSSPCSRV